MGGNGGTGTGPSGQVTATTDRAHYAPTDTIAVTLTNGLADGILAPDHQTNCTTVTLERQDGAMWQGQNHCRLMIATRLVPFAAGTATTVRLQPQVAAVGGTAAWTAGTYRVAFSYLFSAGASGITVYSPNFTIG